MSVIGHGLQMEMISLLPSMTFWATLVAYSTSPCAAWIPVAASPTTGIRFRGSRRNGRKAAAYSCRHIAREVHDFGIQRCGKSRSLRKRQRHIADFAAGVESEAFALFA